MFEAISKVMPDAITYNAVINACSKGKQAERALKVFEALRVKELVPVAITYNDVINACSKGKQPELALEVLKH